jgi:hypothetical protein
MNSYKVSAKQVPASEEEKTPVPVIDPSHAFDVIFREKRWGGSTEDFSGTGASLEQTRVVREELPKLCAELNVQRLLDLPCGDFFWMKHTDLTGISYIGADIVREIIDRNSQEFGDPSNGRRFMQLNLCEDPLPDADLVFCRDCLVHLSFSDVSKALRNVCRSSARYLLTTTFPRREKNIDISTGEWRTINFSLSPFLFPPPVKIINEHCTLQHNEYADKSLALWRVQDLAMAVRRLAACEPFHNPGD